MFCGFFLSVLKDALPKRKNNKQYKKNTRYSAGEMQPNYLRQIPSNAESEKTDGDRDPRLQKYE